MTGEELIEMTDRIKITMGSIEDIGYTAGEGEVSDEQLDEVMASISQISSQFDDPERAYAAMVRREEALFEKREKNSN